MTTRIERVSDLLSQEDFLTEAEADEVAALLISGDETGSPVTQIDVRQWCAADGTTDDSSSFLAALQQANGQPIRIPQGVTVNLQNLVDVADVPVRITGEGKIRHTRKGGLRISQSLVSLGTISAFAAPVSLPSNFDSAKTSKFTLQTAPPSQLQRGSIVLVSSGDALPEMVDAVLTPAFLGELARVHEISGNDVTLSGLLEFSYTTNPVVHLLTESEVVIDGVTFEDPNYLSENTGFSGSAVELVNCVRPKITCDFIRQANAALQFVGCWSPKADVRVDNSRNNHADGSYGYGLLLTAATAFGDLKVIGVNNRHTVSGGAVRSPSAAYKGAPRHNTVRDSLAIAPLNAGFDTHEAQYHTRFIDCWVHKQTGNIDNGSEPYQYDFSDRGAGTQYINCGSVGSGGLMLAGAEHNRQGATGKWTTRVINHHADADILAAGTGLRVLSAANATVAAYHEIEISGGSFRKHVVTIGDAAPRIRFDRTVLRGQDGSFGCGSSNTVILRGIERRTTGTLPNILVGSGTTLTVDDYTAEGSSHSNNSLIHSADGTATIKVGRIQIINAVPAKIVSNNGTTPPSSSLLNGPVRPIAKGASRPDVSGFEIGQVHIHVDNEVDPPIEKPIWWTGIAWVDAAGALQ